MDIDRYLVKGQIEREKDRWMDGWMDGWSGIDWQTKRQRKIYNDRQIDRYIDRQIEIYEWMDEYRLILSQWIDRKRERQIDGWMGWD